MVRQLFTVSVVAIIAMVSTWLVGQVGAVEVHSVNFSNQPMVTVGKEGSEGRVLRLCVDSRATSGCISTVRMNLVKVTNSKPKAKVKVASGALLPVVAIGDLMLTDLSGFVFETDGTRTPTTTSGTWHNILVVDGLDPNTVLVSVRQMREMDGIFTYFNDDNEARVSDCLKLPNGVYVPFSSDRFEVTGTVPNWKKESNSCNLVHGPDRSSFHIHTALCHAGAQRVQTILLISTMTMKQRSVIV